MEKKDNTDDKVQNKYLLEDMVCYNIFVKKKKLIRETQYLCTCKNSNPVTKRSFKKQGKLKNVIHHVSCVTCHLSPVTCLSIPTF